MRVQMEQVLVPMLSGWEINFNINDENGVMRLAQSLHSCFAMSVGEMIRIFYRAFPRDC